MENMMLSPKEIAKKTVEIGQAKVGKDNIPEFVLAFMAGMFIAFGAIGYTVMTAITVDPGLGKFLGSAVFPVGIMFVILAGGDLFTGNCLVSLGYLNKKYPLKSVIKNWGIVLLGNAVGALFIVGLVYYGDLWAHGGELTSYGEKAIAIANKKVGNPFLSALLKGVLCNILVSLTVWISFSAKDVTGKIFACYFPIVLFAMSGYEHIVANFFMIPIGKVLGANITWSEIIFTNFIPVTLGNIIGGGIIIPVLYYYVYLKKSDSEIKEVKKVA
jgi:formate/nitrite transporter